MNRTVGLLAAFAISVAMHAFGEDVKNPWVWTPADAESDSASFPTYADGKYDGAFSLNSGTLVFDDLSEKFPVKEGFSVNVSGEVELDAWDRRKIVFKYHSNSGNYENHTEYSNSCFTESIKDFITKKNPIAPDGASLSGKIVFASGFFFVPENEVGSWLFEGIYDDNVLLKIDGKQLFKTGSYTDCKQGSTETLGYGWHRFEIRARDGSGEWGAANFLKAQSPGSNGLQPFYEGNFQMGSSVTEKSASRYALKALALEDGAKVIVKNEAVVGDKLSVGESCEVCVPENSVLDLYSAQVSGSVKKTGSGAIVFGDVLPEGLIVESGTLVLKTGVAYDMDKVTLGEGVVVRGLSTEGKFVAVGGVRGDDGKTTYSPLPVFSYTGSEEFPSGGFGSLCVSGEETFLTIDSSVACDVLSEVIVRSGATLKVDSHVTIDRLVLEGSGALVVGEGGNVKLSTCSEETVDGQAAVISVLSGGALKTTGPVAVSSVCLKGDASLVIESFTAEIAEFVFEEDSEAFPVFEIAKRARLFVPGGLCFGSVNLRINGTLSAAGDLVLGYSAAEKNCLFDLTVDGGTIRANSGVLKFLCPDGTITVPDNTITFKSAVFESGVSGVYLKPQFCDTLPIEQSILFDCDNTLIDFPTGSYILRGSTRFNFTNGGGITKSNTAVGNRAALWIAEKVKISMSGGASFFYGEAQAGDSVGGSALGFQPDDEDFESFSISGGEIKWHRTGSNGAHGQYEGRNVGGNGKAKIFVDGTIFRTVHGTWSRGQIFENFKEVKLGEGGVVVINDSNAEALNIAAPLTGSGGVSVTNNKSALFRLTVKKNHFNTATGAFTIGENVRLILEEGANWQGTFPWSDQVEIHSFQSEQPFNLTFGGLNLSKPLVYRIWSETLNDKINFVGEGIIPNGNGVQIQLMNGYEPLPGMVFDLGEVSENFDIDSVINPNEKWEFKISEMDSVRHLTVVVKVIDESKLVFNGGEKGAVVDLREATGWAGGFIPSGQDVTVDGVDLELNYKVPAFSSVALKNGAKITVSTDNSLPLLKLSSGAELVVKEGSVLDLSAVPSVLFEESDDFSLPVIKVESGAVLTLPNTSIFRGVKMDIQGTLKVLNKGDLTFGYAQAGEIIPFGLVIDGGSVLVAEGNINFACPAEGGTVVAAGGLPWTVSDATLTPGSAYGFNFGKNNDNTRMIDVVFNNTRLSYSATGIYYIQGAMSVFLKNGSVLHKGANTGYAESMLHVDNNSRLVFENAELYWSAGAHGGSVGSGALYLNPIEDGWCSLEIKDSSFFYHHLMSNRKAAIKIDNSVYNCDYSTYNYLMPFHGKNVSSDDGAYNPAYVELEGDLKFHLRKEGIKMIVPDNVSFRGKGGIEVSNPGEGYFVSTLAIRNGQNTATGAIFAGEGCKLYFRNDANWAGKVVANGNMELVSSTSSYTHDSPVTVAFAKLDLQADFPVKVWKDGNGNITGNDTLNVGEYINNGGRLVPEIAGEGEFVLGDKIVVGEIGDSSPLPRVAKGWSVSRKTIDGKSMLVLGKGVGFMVIVR